MPDTSRSTDISGRTRAAATYQFSMNMGISIVNSDDSKSSPAALCNCRSDSPGDFCRPTSYFCTVRYVRTGTPYSSGGYPPAGPQLRKHINHCSPGQETVTARAYVRNVKYVLPYGRTGVQFSKFMLRMEYPNHLPADSYDGSIGQVRVRWSNPGQIDRLSCPASPESRDKKSERPHRKLCSRSCFATIVEAGSPKVSSCSNHET